MHTPDQLMAENHAYFNLCYAAGASYLKHFDDVPAATKAAESDVLGELVAALRGLMQTSMRFCRNTQCPCGICDLCKSHNESIVAADAILAKLPAETTNKEG